MKRLLLAMAACALWATPASGQSWTAPRTWVASEMVTASLLNTHIRDNLTVLRAGGIAITSQGANEIIYATSATQLGRAAAFFVADGSDAKTFTARQSTDGTAKYGALAVGNDAGAARGVLRANATSFTSAAPNFGDGVTLESAGANGLSVAATNAAGVILFYAGGSTLRGKISAAGELTMVSQPGFLAYNSSTDSGLSSGGMVDLDTEIYDEGADFASDTFTAPVTGRYAFEVCGRLTTGSTTQDRALRIVTSNRSYQIDFAFSVTSSDYTGHCGGVVADMDAGDTAHVEVYVTSGTIAIVGGASPYETFFSGRLLP